jgi:Flp pilus assembly CpaE family ATPase
MRHWDRVAESLRAAAGASPELLKALAPGSDPNGLARDFAAKLFCAFKTVPDVAANTSKLRGAVRRWLIRTPARFARRSWRRCSIQLRRRTRSPAARHRVRLRLRSLRAHPMGARGDGRCVRG